MVWCNMVWYGVAWYGMAWYGVVWYGTGQSFFQYIMTCGTGKLKSIQKFSAIYNFRQYKLYILGLKITKM